MRAEDKVEDKSLVLSDPRGVTPGSSSLARRGLNPVSYTHLTLPTTERV